MRRSVGDCFGVAQIAASGNTMYAKSFDFCSSFDGFLRPIEISNCYVRSGTSERKGNLASDPARSARD